MLCTSTEVFLMRKTIFTIFSILSFTLLGAGVLLPAGGALSPTVNTTFNYAASTGDYIVYWLNTTINNTPSYSYLKTVFTNVSLIDNTTCNVTYTTYFNATAAPVYNASDAGNWTTYTFLINQTTLVNNTQDSLASLAYMIPRDVKPSQVYNITQIDQKLTTIISLLNVTSYSGQTDLTTYGTTGVSYAIIFSGLINGTTPVAENLTNVVTFNAVNVVSSIVSTILITGAQSTNMTITQTLVATSIPIPAPSNPSIPTIPGFPATIFLASIALGVFLVGKTDRRRVKFV